MVGVGTNVVELVGVAVVEVFTRNVLQNVNGFLFVGMGKVLRVQLVQY